MSYKITDLVPGILDDTKQKASIFLRNVCDAVIVISTPKTPKDKGNLSRDTIRQVLGLHGTIEWRKVYAQYQERGARQDGSRRVKKYTTPGTGAHFAENAVKEVVKQTAIIAQKSGLI